MPDCGFCHTAVQTAPSLARLLPGGRVRLAVAPLVAYPGESVDTWRTALAAALEEEGVTVVTEAADAAPALELTVIAAVGSGSTDAGSRFSAVRYDAILRVGRAEVTVRGAPFVGDAEPPRERARAELIARIVPVVAY